MIAKLWAIFLRDLFTAASYRLSFLMQLVAPMFFILSFFFLGRLLAAAAIPGLDRYGGDYFGFALVGIVFSSFVGIALGTVVTTTRRGQMLGTLEVVLTTRTSLGTFIAGSAIYAVLRSALFLALYLALGHVIFGVSFAGANFFVGALVLLLSMAVMVGFGIISGSFILVFKHGDPLSFILTPSAFLLSGVLYPVAVLPEWLQAGSLALPHTYALEALRMALLQGAPTRTLLQELGALALFVVVVLPVSLLAFRYAVYRARTEGSFAQF